VFVPDKPPAKVQPEIRDILLLELNFVYMDRMARLSLCDEYGVD
jgi:hypothetical protein